MIVLEVLYSPGMVAVGVAMCIIPLVWQIRKDRFAESPQRSLDESTSNKISGNSTKQE